MRSIINKWICGTESWSFEVLSCIEKKFIQYLGIFCIQNYNFSPSTKVTFSEDFMLSDGREFTVLQNYLSPTTSFSYKLA